MRLALIGIETKNEPARASPCSRAHRPTAAVRPAEGRSQFRDRPRLNPEFRVNSPLRWFIPDGSSGCMHLSG